MASHEIVTKLLQRHHNGDELSIGCAHVLFSMRHALAKELHRVPTAIVLLLQDSTNTEITCIADKACLQCRIEQLECGGTHQTFLQRLKSVFLLWSPRKSNILLGEIS